VNQIFNIPFVFAGIAAPILALFLRTPHWLASSQQQSAGAIYIVVSILLTGVASLLLRPHDNTERGFWSPDVAWLLRASAAVVALATLLGFLLIRLEDIPRSVPILHFVILVGVVFILRAVVIFHRQRSVQLDLTRGLFGERGSAFRVDWSAPHVQARMSSWADALAAATLLTLPWSTSATSILVVCWLVAAVPTFKWPTVRDCLRRPAVYLPLLLWTFALLGTLWSDAPWADRLDCLRPFHKLLLLPPLIIHFSQSRNGPKVILAFLVSATILLIYSWASLFWPNLVWGLRIPGIPVKDQIYQNICFILAICAFSYMAIDLAEKREYLYSIACSLLAALFLMNILYVATSRTALVVLPVLLLIMAFQRFGGRGALVALLGIAVIVPVIWATSPHLRMRVAQVLEGSLQRDHNALSSEALRLDYWSRSLTAMAEAPLLGHGTGYLRTEFAKGGVDETGAPSTVANPHNQTFAVGVQLGIAGILLLFLMWFSHLYLFATSGPYWTAHFGLMIVVQNMVASVFNSHLSDFTAGWLYVLGVGILGGTVLRRRRVDAVACDPPQGQMAPARR
jgi:hypothetical protein